MALHVLLTSEVLDAHYDEENAWLYLDWKGPQELGLVQAAGSQLLKILEETGVRKVLNDNTNITETSWDLVKWVANDYLPLAGEKGLDYVAWVCSPLLSCRSNIDVMSTFIDRRPQVALFDEVAAAYEWLSSLAVSIQA